MELPVELPAAVQEVWLILALRTVVVGAAVVGVAVVTLVSAPGQRSIRIGLSRYSKKGTPFHFHRGYNVLRCYSIQVARLGQPTQQ